MIEQMINMSEKVTKKSFVSPDGKTPQPTGKEPLKPEVSLMLIYGKLAELLDVEKELLAIFKSAKGDNNTVSAPAVSAQKETPVEAEPEVDARYNEIMSALAAGEEDYTNDVTVEVDTDTMFYIVRPNGWLGNEKFRKVNDIIRKLSGEYQSAGKNSHWKVPKA